MPKSKNEIEKPKKSNSLKGKPRVITPKVLENKGGRPSQFDEASPKIISYIRAGNTYSCACACARISYNTFNEWMKKGLEDIKNKINSQFSKFYEDVKEAEAQCEQEIIGHWLKQVPTSWQAGKEYLARKNPENWSIKDKLDLTSNGETIGKDVFLPMKKEIIDE